MAEWLRLWTLNLKGSVCMFDSRQGRFFFSFFSFLMRMAKRRAAAQASAKRERRRYGMSAANYHNAQLLCHICENFEENEIHFIMCCPLHRNARDYQRLSYKA